MKITSMVLAIALSAAIFAGCSTSPAPRLVYQQSQFESRLEYLRFLPALRTVRPPLRLNWDDLS